MDTTEWYYLAGEQTVGPFSEEQLASLQRAGAITNSTLIWHKGTDQWKPICEALPQNEELPPPLPQDPGVRAKQAISTAPPPTESPKATTAKTAKWSDTSPHPWRRGFARLLDTIINGNIVLVVLLFLFYAAAPEPASNLIKVFNNPGNELWGSILTWFLAIPLNTIFIGLTGLSLGKWLFGVRILNSEGGVIGMSKAFYREFSVWAAGVALGIPLLNLFAADHAMKDLKANGVTSWDKSANIQVVHREAGPVQFILGLVGVITFFGAFALFSQK